MVYLPSPLHAFITRLTSSNFALSFNKKWISKCSIIIAFLSYSFFLIWAAQDIPIWIDEAATISIASKDFFDIVSFCLNDWDAPHLFYYLICHLVLEVFPSSLFALRCISIVAALLSICFVYQIGKKVLSKEKAIVGAVFFSIAPVTFNSATQARSPMLVILFSSLILYLIVKQNFISGRLLITINLLLGLNVLMNFLSYIFAVICFTFLFATQSSTKSRRLLVSFFSIPTLFCMILVNISRAKNTTSWIADDFSPLGSLHRVLLWPLIENTRNLPILIAMVLVFVFVGFFRVKIFNWDQLKKNRELSLCVAVGFLPPLLLWLISIFFPIFQTRYFAYSVIGVSLFLSSAFTRRSRRSFLTLLATFLISVSALQVFHIWHGRGASFDWAIYESEISKGPQNQTLVVKPLMFSFLLEYYTNNEIPILSIKDILEKLDPDSGVLCSDSVANVILIFPTEFTDGHESEIEILLNNGYGPIQDTESTNDRVRRYRLIDCD
jgi:4-amino-4-deoxy-L-arabinose transferase-like glycosyltransferase